MKRKRYCQRCETAQVPRGIKFCSPCAKEISAAYDKQMDRAVAARAWFSSQNRNTESGRQEEVFAFLSIIHPEIPTAKALRIARDCL